MPLAQVKVSRIVQGEWDWLGQRVPGRRRWGRRAGTVQPTPVGPYRAATGYAQFRHKVLTARPFSYRAAMDRPFPDPGLRVPVATERMLPAVHPWGRYTVPHPGRFARLNPAYFTAPSQLPNRPTLSGATGYYTAAEEALGLGDPGLAGFKIGKLVKKIGRVVGKITPKEVSKVVGISFAPLAATGILGVTAKKSAMKTLKVTGKALQVVAPALSFIPGWGPALAAGASLVGQMETRWARTGKPFSVFHKPLAPLAQAAGSALVGYGVTGVGSALTRLPALLPSVGGLFGGGPTGNVASAGDQQRAAIEAEYGVAPPPTPSIGWGEVAETVGKVVTALFPPPPPPPAAGSPAEARTAYEAQRAAERAAAGAYVPGSAGYEGAPAEAPPAAPSETGAPPAQAGMGTPLLVGGGLLLLLLTNR